MQKLLILLLANALVAVDVRGEVIVVGPGDSLAAAAAKARAGDVVRVRAGVYRETVALHRSGTRETPIRFESDPPGAAIISGADVIKDFEREPGDAPIYRVAWQHRFQVDERDGKPIESHPQDSGIWGRAEQVICDGKLLLQTEDLAKMSTQPPVTNLGGPFAGIFSVDTTKKILRVRLADGSDPNSHVIEASTRGQIFGINPWENKIGVQFIEVRGFVFRYAANFAQRAAVCIHGKNNLLEDCVIENMNGTGVMVGGTLRRCVVRNNGHTGGSAAGDGFVNEDCTWEGNTWKPIDRGWEAGGAKVCLDAGGVFRRCAFRRNGGPGLWFDIDANDIDITHCIFDGNESSGMFIEISRKIRVRENFFTRNGIGVIGSDEQLWGASGIQIGESRECVIENNTIVDNQDGIAIREQGPRPLDTRDGKIDFFNTGHVIRRNIIANNRGYQLAFWYDNIFFGPHPSMKEPESGPAYDPLQQKFQIDENLYFASAEQKLFLYGADWRNKSRKFASLRTFTGATKFESSGKVADPKFKGNFELNADSPAIDMKAGWQSVKYSP